MANPEHLEILKKGVEAWNVWRAEGSEEVPDLRVAKLSGANLIRADIIHANLGSADLSSTDLSRTNLSGAELGGAELTRASCGAQAWPPWTYEWHKGSKL